MMDIGSTRRNERNERRRRRGSSSKRKIGTIGNGRPHKDRKENRTIYDSDSSIDSAFEINKRMKIDPVSSAAAAIESHSCNDIHVVFDSFKTYGAIFWIFRRMQLVLKTDNSCVACASCAYGYIAYLMLTLKK